MNDKLRHLLSELPMFGTMLIVFITYTLLFKDIGILHIAILATYVYFVYYRYQRLKQLWSHIESINRGISYNYVMTINLNALKKINNETETEVKIIDHSGGDR